MGGIFHWRLHLTGIVLRVQDGNVDLGREPGANVAGDTVCGESAGLRCAQPRDGQRRGFVERPAGPLDKTESLAIVHNSYANGLGLPERGQAAGWRGLEVANTFRVLQPRFSLSRHVFLSRTADFAGGGGWGCGAACPRGRRLH